MHYFGVRTFLLLYHVLQKKTRKTSNYISHCESVSRPADLGMIWAMQMDFIVEATLVAPTYSKSLFRKFKYVIHLITGYSIYKNSPGGNSTGTETILRPSGIQRSPCGITSLLLLSRPLRSHPLPFQPWRASWDSARPSWRDHSAWSLPGLPSELPQ